MLSDMVFKVIPIHLLTNIKYNVFVVLYTNVTFPLMMNDNILSQSSRYFLSKSFTSSTTLAFT